MTSQNGQLKAVRPAQIAREMLGDALGLIQDIKNKNLDVEKVTASIAKAVGALFAVQTSDPNDPGHVAGVCQAMDHLKETLELMQNVEGEDDSLTNATQAIAKTLAILYPISQVQARQSVLVETPPAIIGEDLPHDGRRSVQRTAIEADIGFQSDSNFFTGFTEDISEGGLFLATFDTKQIGDELLVNFTLPDGYLVSVTGIVRWIREYNENAQEAEPGMGIQFDSLKEEDKIAINSFLTQREPIFFDT